MRFILASFSRALGKNSWFAAQFQGETVFSHSIFEKKGSGRSRHVQAYTIKKRRSKGKAATISSDPSLYPPGGERRAREVALPGEQQKGWR
jgi:hypothetical protein